MATGRTATDLIEVAGTAVAEWLAHRFSLSQSFVVCVGPGNNGADGLVCARHLHQSGYRVQLVTWRRPADMWLAQIATIPHHEVTPGTLPAIASLLAETDVIVDALLGIGANRPLIGDLAELVAAINQRPASTHCVALDIPSGCHADTGALLGVAVHADITLSTGPKKQGLCFAPAHTQAGRIHLLDIGLIDPPSHLAQCHELTVSHAQGWVPERPANAYKGTFGTVCVWAGSAAYPGAAVLASSAALRSGAGIVSLATEAALVPLVWRQPELTLTLLDDNPLEKLSDARFRAYVVGPGLGRSDVLRARLAQWCDLLAPQPRPVVFDADALTVLSEMPAWPQRLSPGTAVLTPHLGELRRLCGGTIPDMPPVPLAQQLARQWQQVLVMKGSTTVIAHPDGQVFVWPHPNPVLATGGSGDVLAGIIGAMLAQGCAPFVAAALSVVIQGVAAAQLRSTLGVAGVLPSDMVALLPQMIQALRTRTVSDIQES